MDVLAAKNREKLFSFDYLYGRVLKVDLSGDEFEESLYDRDNCGTVIERKKTDA